MWPVTSPFDLRPKAILNRKPQSILSTVFNLAKGQGLRQGKRKKEKERGNTHSRKDKKTEKREEQRETKRDAEGTWGSKWI